ncbi:P pilus assembly protein, pilin FimA [Pragia fontium]|uniref:fimbrial protein n=1 Tax=Pragia fontium TaxID=82985 RepID=UPI000E030D09|nr:fimbrial protein [Pragia fontium]SUB84084.1 P pilus assembly protein, pilin FimA [Pragia fontium]
MANRSLYIITLLSLLLSVDAWGARCTGLMLKYNIPQIIDVTDKKAGDRLYSFGEPSGPMLYSGQCLRGTNTNGNHIYLVDQYRKASTGLCAYGRVNKISADNYLRFTANANCGDTAWLLLSDRTTSGNGYAALKGPGGDIDSGILYLENKTPLGKTTVNPTFMLTRNFYSRIGEHQSTLMKEMVTFTAPPSIVLINKVSCSVAVNDVSFGTQTVGALKSGTIADKSINIDFSCNGVLPAYTLSFSGQDGVNNADNGIIKVKDNASIGYQFKWGNALVKPTNSAVTVNDSPISPATLPKGQNFTVPILVKPVLLSASPIPGNANTALIIKVTLN